MAWRSKPPEDWHRRAAEHFGRMTESDPAYATAVNSRHPEFHVVFGHEGGGTATIYHTDKTRATTSIIIKKDRIELPFPHYITSFGHLKQLVAVAERAHKALQRHAPK